MKIREIAEFLDAELVGDASVEIIGVASVASASTGEIAFLEKNIGQVASRADCLIVPADFDGETPIPLIKTANPKLAFARVAAILHPQKRKQSGIDASAVIAETAAIGSGVFVDAFVSVGNDSAIGSGTYLLAGTKIGDGVMIGKNCFLHPNVVIQDGCLIGNDVILHSGAVVGADGFGYVRDAQKYVKFPQIGVVVIEDDVEIGANSCIDRGSLGETRIGKGTKIDNLVQIAHNVQIGERVIIAAQTGISGSTVVEDDCVIGGQVGMGDHALVKSGAIIGSQAGVLPGKIVRPGVWWGTPVQPLSEYKRQNAHVKSLQRLKDDVIEIKKLMKK